MQAIKVLSSFLYIHFIGVPWVASPFTPINQPVLSMSMPLPAWLNTLLCFLTGRPDLFLCYHSHTPHVLRLTIVFTTVLPYFGLRMKKV